MVHIGEDILNLALKAPPGVASSQLPASSGIQAGAGELLASQPPAWSHYRGAGWVMQSDELRQDRALWPTTKLTLSLFCARLCLSADSTGSYWLRMTLRGSLVKSRALSRCFFLPFLLLPG